MPPGVLWVSSRVANPNVLAPEKMCDWYENQHIQEVVSLPGVLRAARYEAITPQPSPTTWSSVAPWLTVYEMPDIEYRHTKEFKSLDGQSRPNETLLKGIFEQARFDTRFYSKVQTFEPEGTEPGPAKFLISAALQPVFDQDEDFDKWYREEHLRVLSEVPGYRRSRRYEVANATVLDRFVRKEVGKDLRVPKYLALHEFDGKDLPWDQLRKSAETMWAKKIMEKLSLEEVGWYGLKRIYGKY